MKLSDFKEAEKLVSWRNYLTEWLAGEASAAKICVEVPPTNPKEWSGFSWPSLWIENPELVRSILDIARVEAERQLAETKEKIAALGVTE